MKLKKKRFKDMLTYFKQSLQKFNVVGIGVKISKRLVLHFERKIYNNKNFEKQNFSKKHHTLTNSKNSQFFTQKFKQKTLKFFIILFLEMVLNLFSNNFLKNKNSRRKYRRRKNRKMIEFYFCNNGLM